MVCSCSYLHYFFSVQKNSSDIHLSFLILVMCFFFLSLFLCVVNICCVNKARGLSVLLIFFKGLAFAFADFLCWFPVFNPIHFCSNFYYVFSSAYFAFNLLFFF